MYAWCIALHSNVPYIQTLAILAGTDGKYCVACREDARLASGTVTNSKNKKGTAYLCKNQNEACLSQLSTHSHVKNSFFFQDISDIMAERSQNAGFFSS